MPGMMDTVLNLGLNDETVEGLAALSGNARFAWDSYRRFCAMFGDVVLGLKPERKEDRDPFEVILEAKKRASGVRYDSELPVEALRELVAEFKAAIRERPRHRPARRTRSSSCAWPSAPSSAPGTTTAPTPTASSTTSPSTWGTAVTVQAMVFGNMGEDSGTGVAFTRNPATGENEFYGEFLVNAQGEDVVAGIRTPQKIGELAAALARPLPRSCEAVRGKLERHYRDMQDIEFTIERGRLYVLQTRTGKRTGMAAVRIAVEMAEQKLISREEALLHVDPEALNHLLRPIFDAADKAEAVGEGRLLATGPAGRPRRRLGPAGLLRRGRRGLAPQRRAGDPGAPRDQPGGHPRHGRGRGHPHRLRRHDQPRRAGGPADGQGVHRRLRGALASTTRPAP